MEARGMDERPSRAMKKKQKRTRWESSDEGSGSDTPNEKKSRQGQLPTAKSSPPTESLNEEPPAEVGLGPVDVPKVETDTEATTQGQAATSEPSQEESGSTPTHNPLLFGCRSVDSYSRLGKIDEGTYGVVFKARDKETGDIVALKQVKMTRDSCREGFPITALRETNILIALKHPNIINVREMVVGSSFDKIFMVMDFADSDIKSVMETKMKQPFSHAEVKCLMVQLLSAVNFMHENWYIHRDLKTSNLLYSAGGRLSVCDFGLARKYGDPIRAYTHNVVTLWYRCPELLLGAKTYSTAVDMWSVGCIMAEFLTRSPLFPARGEIEALDMIFKLLGAPSEETWPGYSSLPNASNVKWKAQKHSKLREKFPLTSFTGGIFLSNTGFDLLNRLLALDPNQRLSAAEALDHEWFREFPPPKAKELMPSFSSGSDPIKQPPNAGPDFDRGAALPPHEASESAAVDDIY